MRPDSEWMSRLRGPVRPRGVAWTVGGLLLALGVTEGIVLPLVAATGLQAPVQIILAVVAGALIRVGLGVFVAWRLLRMHDDDVVIVVRTVIAAMLATLLLLWFASWLVIRPVWDLGEWAAEVGLFAAGTALWVVPVVGGAYWFTRAHTTELSSHIKR